MASERFQFLVESKESGTENIEKVVAAVNKLSSAFDDSKKKAESHGSSMEYYAEKVKAAIENPLGAAGSAAKSLIGSLGAVGGAVLGSAAVIGTLAAVGFEGAKALGELATQVNNVHLRTGLTTKEVGQFSFAAKVAGSDIGVFEGAMRKLSQGLSDSTEDGKKSKEALKALGVQARDVHGELKPTKEIFLEISEALGKMGSAVERNNAVVKIFGRQGVELIPVLMGLNENVARAKELGLGMSEKDVEKFEEYHKRIVEIEGAWARLKRTMMKPIAATIMFFLSQETRDKGAMQGASYGKGGDWNIAGGQGYESDWLGDMLKRITDKTTSDMKAGQNQLSVDAGKNRLAAIEKELLSTKNGLQGQASRARSTADDALASLRESDGMDESVVSKREAIWRKAEAAAAGYEARLKALQKSEQDTASELQRIVAFLKEAKTAGEVSEEPFMKETARWVERAKGMRFTPAQQAAFSESIEQIASAEYAKEAKKYTENWIKYNLDSVKELRSQWQAIADVELKKAADRIENMSKAAIDWGKQLDDVRFSKQKSGAESDASHDMSVVSATIGVTAGVAAEYSYRRRISLAHELYAIEESRIERQVSWLPFELQFFAKSVALLRARGDEEKALDEAKKERELRLLEIQKERLETLKTAAGQIWDSLETKGVTGLQQFLQGYLKSIPRTIFQNSFAELLKGTAGKLALPGLTTTDDKGNKVLNPMGRILQGTPFGADPAALQQTTAANVQMTAAQMQLQAASMASGASTVAGVSGIGGDVSEMFPAASARAGASASGLKGWQRGTGIAASAAAGGFGIYSGVKQGGAQGALTAGGAAAAMIGGILPLLSKGLSAAGPIGMAIGAGLMLGSMLLGDPKKKRDQYLTEEAERRKFTDPVGADYARDQYGRAVDSNRNGETRSVTVNVQTIDSKSFLDHVETIGEVARRALTDYQPFATEVMSLTRGA